MIGRRDRIVIILAAIFAIVGFWFMFFGNFRLEFRHARHDDVTVMPEATGITANVGTAGMIEQYFVCSSDTLSAVSLVFARNYYVEDSQIAIELSDGYRTLASMSIDANAIASQHRTFLYPEAPLSGLKNDTLILRIYSVYGTDSGIALMYDATAASRFRFGADRIKGSICFAIEV